MKPDLSWPRMLMVNAPRCSDKAPSTRRALDRDQLEQPQPGRASPGRSAAICLPRGVSAVDLARRNCGKLDEAAPSQSPDVDLCRHKIMDRNSADYAWKRRCLGDVLVRIGDKWMILVLAALGSERRRFKTLQRDIDGISQRMLTVTLRVLERDGVVVRTVYPEVPPRVEYELSDRGRSLKEALRPFSEWVQANRDAVERSRQIFDEGVRLSEDPWTTN